MTFPKLMTNDFKYLSHWMVDMMWYVVDDVDDVDDVVCNNS